MSQHALRHKPIRLHIAIHIPWRKAGLALLDVADVLWKGVVAATVSGLLALVIALIAMGLYDTDQRGPAIAAVIAGFAIIVTLLLLWAERENRRIATVPAVSVSPATVEAVGPVAHIRGGLAERLVHLVEIAIEDQADAEDVTHNPLGTKVYGFLCDFARYGGAALADGLADDLLGQRCCSSDSVTCCSDCLLLDRQAASFRALAVSVRAVPALEAI